MSHLSTSEIQILGVAEDDYREEGTVRAFRVVGFAEDWLGYLNEQAQRVALASEDNMRKLSSQSSEMWCVYAGKTPIIFIGFIPYSFLGISTYVWCIPFEGLRAYHLPRLSRMFDRATNKFPLLVAKVFTAYSRAERFAEFFKFVSGYQDGPFTVYVRRNYDRH